MTTLETTIGTGGGVLSSLLEKAKAVQVKPSTKKGATHEEVALAVAWFKDQVTGSQVAAALGMNNAIGASDWCARVLKLALQAKQADLIAIEPGDEDEIDDSREPPAPVLARAVRR